MDAFKHSFIFSPGTWMGEGKIVLSMVEENLLFNTNWSVQTRDFSGKVQCAQDIQIQGLSDGMRNELSFFDFQNNTFSVEMENQNIGKILGTGIYDDQVIGWEFRNRDMNFEGFETYHLQEDGSYAMRGEYITSDQFRTQIEARIWLDAKGSSFTEEEPNEGEES
jgi:hypothetical protein